MGRKQEAKWRADGPPGKIKLWRKYSQLHYKF